MGYVVRRIPPDHAIGKRAPAAFNMPRPAAYSKHAHESYACHLLPAAPTNGMRPSSPSRFLDVAATKNLLTVVVFVLALHSAVRSGSQ